MDKIIRSLKLCDLAIACSIYDALTPFNESLRRLKRFTASHVDLSNPCHRIFLLDWLNDWGCRHLSKDSHPIASKAIQDWHKREGTKLFPIGKTIWELDDQELATVTDAYGFLKDKTGARKTRGDKILLMDIGPTAASKILFAVRPEALMPWDEAMRNEFGCDDSKQSYFKFLVEIRKLAYKIRKLCKANGFDVSELPHRIDRDGSTVLELINEYIWITITRKCKLPSAKSLMLWAGWGLSAKKN